MTKESKHNTRVVIGLSGGVDSSVAAYLLKQQGYDVTALFMINWHETTGTLKGDCPWDDDLIFAELVARKIGIPFHSVDLSEQYRKRVVDYMFDEYAKGRTPNPDVLCNREVKFDIFVEAAKKYGAEYVATGHYCRKEEINKDGEKIYRLLAGTDKNKDQSYFLCQLSQKQLSTALFPIGDIAKPKVRDIATKQSFATAEKKDSQGICFVGKVNLPEFLQQKLESRKGRIIEIPADSSIFGATQNTDGIELAELKEITKDYPYSPNDGKNLGTHQGAHFFTIGQRKGLDVGGTEKPLYVISTDVEKNIVYVGQGEEHPGLYREGLFVPKSETHWVRPDLAIPENKKRRWLVRIRYRQALQSAEIFMKKDGMYIIFDKAQRGITSGQFAALYDDEELIGSGVIQ